VYLTNANLDAEGVLVPAQVFSNQSISDSGRGGGFFLGGPAELTFTGSINSNSAGYGGGIFAAAGTDNLKNVFVRLKGVTTGSPVSVSNNGAVHDGGAMYCAAYGIEHYAITCSIFASDFTIDGNHAQNGSVFFGKADSSFLGFDQGPFLTLGGGDVCRGGSAACNEVRGNYRSSGTSQDGDIIAMPAVSAFGANNVRFQQNQGAHLFKSTNESFSYTQVLHTVLITDNQVDDVLIDVPSTALDVQDATIAHNDLRGTNVIRAQNSLFFYNNIVDERVETFDFGNNTGVGHNIGDVLTNPFDLSMTRADGLVLHGYPTFVDVAHDNYHLAPFSVGIDVGTANPDIPRDLDGNPRDVDEPEITNRDGPRDLGAYEFFGALGPPPPCSESDKIFCSQFE
jgi:predicted outer membrane repeat protein